MAVTNEPAPHKIPWGLEWQQHLARQQNNASLSAVIGDGTGLEGDLTTLEGVVAALVSQIPAIGTPQDTTSGTEKDFDIPSWATQITMPLNGVSTNGTSNIICRIGDATSFESSGYLGSVSELTDASAVVATVFSTSFILVTNNAAARTRYGAVTLTLIDSSTNTWSAAINIGSDTTKTYGGGGTKSLTGPLTRIRLTTNNGTDTFDAGKVNVRYA